MTNEPTSSTIIPLIIIGFLVVFPLFWSGIVLLISKLGGWATMAKAYPGEVTMDGRAFNWHSARLNYRASYSKCLNFTLSHNGLHMVPMVLFRKGHPPIFIPWEKIDGFQTTDFWLTCSGKISVMDPDNPEKTNSFVVYGRSLVNAIEEQLSQTMK